MNPANRENSTSPCRRWFRFRARTIILTVAVVCVPCIWTAGYLRSELYRHGYLELHNGDSIQFVRGVLGSGQTRDPETFVLIADRRPDWYPNGVRESDTFLVYRWGRAGSAWFQFRNGRLINRTPLAGAMLRGRRLETRG